VRHEIEQLRPLGRRKPVRAAAKADEGYQRRGYKGVGPFALINGYSGAGSGEIAKELKTNNGKRIQELEELVGRTVLIKSDAQLHQEQFDINF